MTTSKKIINTGALLAGLLLSATGATAQNAAPAAPPAPQAPPAKIELPASGEKATTALKESPRHGEWADIAVGESKVRAWVSYPERKDKAPVLLVIHEIFGLTDWVRAVADQAAAQGFIAIAPDLLSGKGPGGGGTESFEGDAARAAIRGLAPDEVAARLDATRAYGLALPSAGTRSASMGFCWGGSASFTYATRQPNLNAAVVFYGTGPTDEAALARITCPVLGLYGGDDARVTSTVEPTSKLMAQAGKRFTPRVYENAGHGFLRQQDGRDGANQRAAEGSWAESIAFLKANLEVAAPATGPAAATAPAKAAANAAGMADCH